MTKDPKLPDTPEASALAATQYAITSLHRCNLKKNTVHALEAMAFEGLPLPRAAEQFNIRPDNLLRAFDRPHVRTAFNQVVKAIRDNAAQAAYLRINHMSLTASSEQVKLKANAWVAGVDGISPVQKVQGQHQINHSFGGFDYGDIVEGEVEPQTQDVVIDKGVTK